MNNLVILNISNHSLTKEQISIIEKHFNRNVCACLNLPQDLGEKLKNLPDNTKDRLEFTYEILKWIGQMVDYWNCDIGIHVDGEAHFVYLLVIQIQKWIYIKTIFSRREQKTYLHIPKNFYDSITIFKFYSQRKVIEEKQEDGSIKKVSVFEPKNILEY